MEENENALNFYKKKQLDVQEVLTLQTFQATLGMI
jgi:hypothetical protein